MPRSRQCAAMRRWSSADSSRARSISSWPPAVPRRLPLVGGPGRVGRGQQVGAEALELDRVGARRRGGVDQLQGHRAPSRCG